MLVKRMTQCHVTANRTAVVPTCITWTNWLMAMWAITTPISIIATTMPMIHFGSAKRSEGDRQDKINMPPAVINKLQEKLRWIL